MARRSNNSGTNKAKAKADLPAEEFVRKALSLYRYFVWCEALRAEYERARKEDFPKVEQAHDEGVPLPYHEAMRTEMFMCLWFSTLSTVIEGWPALRARDEKVRPLLRSKYKDLLRGFRHAVFHPADLTDSRVAELVAEGQRSYDWAVAVMEAFGEFFEFIRCEDERWGEERLKRHK